ncbi:hypothetical protein [Priestia megaterium]|uniref:hypothetical protein n=1 Tax=Priestia megaterium TaxID=1404 RepID=UPI0035A964B7
MFICFIFIKIIKRSYIKQNFFLKHKKYWCQKFSSKGGSVVYKTTKGTRVMYNAMVLYQMLKVHKIRVEFLKESLRNNKFEKLTPKETAKHRSRFTTSLKNKLIEEWEEKTNQKWPRYTEEVYDQTGEIARHIGQPYDAHHLIENNFSGPHEWWNIHPAKYPDEHQQGIHGKGAPSRMLFPRR